MKFSWFQKQMRKKQRIYILPTRMGGYFNGLIFLMFLLAVGYSNNLLLIFTLFLFGFNLLWVIQTHFHLHALKLKSLQIQDGFAGEKSFVTIHWSKTPSLPHRWELSLHSDNDDFELLSAQETPLVTRGQFDLKSRGVLHLRHLKIKSLMPFGLYASWIYVPVSSKLWVYPARLKQYSPIPQHDSLEEGDNKSARKGPHDVWNLATYQGEDSRRISWKHYARSGDLVVKEGEDTVKNYVHFTLLKNPENKEYYLSKMCSQIMECSAADTLFSMEIPSKKKLKGNSQKHLTDCLRELAEC